MFQGLPDNCAPYVIIYTGAQLSGSGAQLSGPGAQLSGSGARLSAILVCIPTYVISAPLCMYCSSIYESDQGLVAAGYSICNIDLSHWYKVDKVFYTPEAKLRCVKITSYITKRS